jgi:hypothetical protein
MRPWQRRLYGRMVSKVLMLTRRGATSKPDAGWGDLTAEDLRRQGIGPGMGPPGEQGPRAVAMPGDQSR